MGIILTSSVWPWCLSDATYRFFRNIAEVVLRVVHTVLETSARTIDILPDSRKCGPSIWSELAEGTDSETPFVFLEPVPVAVGEVKIA